MKVFCLVLNKMKLLFTTLITVQMYCLAFPNGNKTLNILGKKAEMYTEVYL